MTGAAVFQMTSDYKFIDQTASIVAAYVSHNAIAADQVPALIAKVHGALAQVAGGQAVAGGGETLTPAVPVKRSIFPDYLICLDDGKKFKSLKRHLRTQYKLTPEQYRERWNLPADYPMVAPNYAKTRSQLAKKMGLGQQRKR
jgi:predicted transcriptional regulator